MIYKNNLSKLAMLLLAGTMAFATSCSDEGTTADADKKVEKEGNGNGGNGNQEEEVEIITGLTKTQLSGYKEKLLKAANALAIDTTNYPKFTENLKKSLVNALTAMKFDEGKKAEQKNLDDAFALVVVDSTLDIITAHLNGQSMKKDDLAAIDLAEELSNTVEGKFKNDESKAFKLKGSEPINKLANKVVDHLLKDNKEAEIRLKKSIDRKKGKFYVDKKSDDTLKVCVAIKVALIQN